LIEALVLAAVVAPPSLVVDRRTVQTGEPIVVRIATPRRTQVYLAPSAATIRSRFDTRLRYLGTIARGRQGSFVVPAVNGGRYRLWCTPCARRGPQITVTMPGSCPVSVPAIGGRTISNDAMSTWSDSETAQPRGDGSYAWKMYWRIARPAEDRPLQISASRLGRPAIHAGVGAIRRGTTSPTPSWASVLTFPTTGCWRITALVADVSLVRVVEIRE
jgi:hypothetical protein